MAKFKILVVDDDDDDFFILREAFKELGAELHFERARNGNELLAFLTTCKNSEQEFPDLILLDINMPAMDGLQALETIHSWKITLSLPIIMCSTASGEEVKTRCKNLGANGFITKGCSFKELTDIARVVLNFLRNKLKTTGTYFYFDPHSAVGEKDTLALQNLNH